MRYFLLLISLINTVGAIGQSSYSLDSIRAIEIYHDAVGDGFPKDFDYTINTAKKSIQILDSLGKIRYDSTLFYVMAEQMFGIGFLKMLKDDPHSEVYPILKKTLDTVSQVFGDKHFLATKCMFKLGQLFLKQGNLKEGYRYLQEGIDIRKEILPENDIYLAHAYANLDSYYNYVEDYFHRDIMADKHNSIIGYLVNLRKESELDPSKYIELNKLIHKDRYPIIEAPYLNDIDIVYVGSLLHNAPKHFRYDEIEILKNIISEIESILPDLNYIPLKAKGKIEFLKGRYYLETRDTIKAIEIFQNFLSSTNPIDQLYKLYSKILLDNVEAGDYYEELKKITYENVSSYWQDDFYYVLAYYFLNKKDYVKTKYFLNGIVNFRQIDTLFVRTEQLQQNELLKIENTNSIQLSGCLMFYGINCTIDNAVFNNPSKSQIEIYKQHLKYFENSASSILNSYQNYESSLITAENITDFFDEAINLSLKIYNHTGEAKYQETALQLSDLIRSLKLEFSLRLKRHFYINGKDDHLILNDFSKQIIRYEDLLREELKKNENIGRIAQLKEELVELNQNYEDLILKIREEDPGTLLYGRVDLNKILQYCQQENVMVIEYFVGQNNICLFQISDNGIKSFAFPINNLKEKVENLLSTIREKPGNQEFGSNEKFVNISNEVFKLLFPDNIISLFKTDNIVIIPSGIISYLPFECLIYEKSESRNLRKQNYLINKFNISYDYSLSLIANENNRQKKVLRNYLGFAPSFASDKMPLIENEIFLNESFENERDLGALKFNKEEILSASSFFNGVANIDSAASESNFKIEAKNSDIIHLATHGATNDKYPEYSFLAFNNSLDSIEDGKLFAHEIENMDMNAKLVVLSACNTGFGKYRNGEGILSLSRSFKQSGVSNIIMSLWNANDYSSTEIIKNYFKNLNDGVHSTNALRDAKLDFLSEIENENFAHPYYWATFLHFGNSHFIVESNKWFYSSEMKWGMALLIGLIVFVIYRRLKRDHLIRANN